MQEFNSHFVGDAVSKVCVIMLFFRSLDRHARVSRKHSSCPPISHVFKLKIAFVR
jgi:hypothetical protein